MSDLQTKARNGRVRALDLVRRVNCNVFFDEEMARGGDSDAPSPSVLSMLSGLKLRMTPREALAGLAA